MSTAETWGPGAGPLLYALAFAVYVVLGLLTGSVVLNWIVGPLFPLLALFVVPRLVRGVTRREPGP